MPLVRITDTEEFYANDFWRSIASIKATHELEQRILDEIRMGMYKEDVASRLAKSLISGEITRIGCYLDYGYITLEVYRRKLRFLVSLANIACTPDTRQFIAYQLGLGDLDGTICTHHPTWYEITYVKDDAQIVLPPEINVVDHGKLRID